MIRWFLCYFGYHGWGKPVEAYLGKDSNRNKVFKGYVDCVYCDESKEWTRIEYFKRKNKR